MTLHRKKKNWNGYCIENATAKKKKVKGATRQVISQLKKNQRSLLEEFLFEIKRNICTSVGLKKKKTVIEFWHLLFTKTHWGHRKSGL